MDHSLPMEPEIRGTKDPRGGLATWILLSHGQAAHQKLAIVRHKSDTEKKQLAAHPERHKRIRMDSMVHCLPPMDCPRTDLETVTLRLCEQNKHVISNGPSCSLPTLSKCLANMSQPPT